jgi:hypothetical protein
LNNNIGRLADDHKRAIAIGECLAQCTFVQELLPVHTNIIIFKLKDQVLSDVFLGKLKSEGIIVKRYVEETHKTTLMKIHSDSYWNEKQQNPNYPNRWFCYLDIYKTNNPDFKITDYQTKKNIVEILEYNNKSVDITGMIYVLFKGTAETLFNLVMHFTKFDFKSRTHRNNKLG